MFEIVEIGELQKQNRFLRARAKDRRIKVKCVTSAFCEQVQRNFEGHGNYRVQTYRAAFTEGEMVTIRVPTSIMVAVGDRLGIDLLTADGCLDEYFRLVVTKL